MAEHRVAVDPDVSLHVETDGAGPPVVLVNAAFCGVRSWDHVVPLLAEHLFVVRFDIRGTGASDSGPDDGYRFEQYASDLVAILDNFALDDAGLWGMAWGSRVALVTASLNPHRVSRLMLSDFAIDPADTTAQRDGYVAAKAALADAFVTIPERPVGWNAHRDADAAAKALAATRHHLDLMPFVGQADQPTLIATGEHDPNLASSRRALAGFANAELQVVPLAGHGAAMLRPDVMAQLALGHFLAT